MKRAIAAGGLYFLLIFLVGMALGTVRILLIEPRAGALASVLMELPFMLAASWYVCGRLIRYLPVPAALSSRAVMGGLAFLLLMIAELGLSLFAVGGTVRGHFANYGQSAPLVGLFGQLAFAAFPLLMERRRPARVRALRFKAGRRSGPWPVQGVRAALLNRHGGASCDGRHIDR